MAVSGDGYHGNHGRRGFLMDIELGKMHYGAPVFQISVGGEATRFVESGIMKTNQAVVGVGSLPSP